MGAASRAATTSEDRASGMRMEGTKGRRSKASLALGYSHLYRRQVIRQVFGGRKDPSALRELRGRRRGSTGRAVVRRRESPKAIAGGFEVSASTRKHGRVRACWRNQRADARWSARGGRAGAEKRGERRRVSDESQEPGSNLEDGRPTTAETLRLSSTASYDSVIAQPRRVCCREISSCPHSSSLCWVASTVVARFLHVEGAARGVGAGRGRLMKRARRERSAWDRTGEPRTRQRGRGIGFGQGLRGGLNEQADPRRRVATPRQPKRSCLSFFASALHPDRLHGPTSTLPSRSHIPPFRLASRKEHHCLSPEP